MTSPSALPKLVCFDLDYTLWDLWCDTHVTPPIKRPGDALNQVTDRYGKTFGFYPEVPAMLLRLREDNIHVAAASRTHAPEVARQILTELLVPASLKGASSLKVGGKKQSVPSPGELETIKAIKLFDTLEIFPGSKLTHFRNIHQRTGIPYTEMVFFDDESRNREVEKLGVTFVLVPDGMTKRKFEEGLETWRKRRSATR